MRVDVTKRRRVSHLECFATHASLSFSRESFRSMNPKRWGTSVPSGLGGIEKAVPGPLSYRVVVGGPLCDLIAIVHSSEIG